MNLEELAQLNHAELRGAPRSVDPALERNAGRASASTSTDKALEE